jgi:hypothetical protein
MQCTIESHHHHHHHHHNKGMDPAAAKLISNIKKSMIAGGQGGDPQDGVTQDENAMIKEQI